MYNNKKPKYLWSFKYFLNITYLSKFTLYNTKYCSIIKNCTLRNTIICMHIGLCTWPLGREEYVSWYWTSVLRSHTWRLVYHIPLLTSNDHIANPHSIVWNYTVISFCWHFHHKLFKIIINKCQFSALKKSSQKRINTMFVRKTS